MHIALFGATGPSGQLVLEKALAAGHAVTAYVRYASRLQVDHPGLHVITGELTDAAAIASTIAGQGAVISLLGPKGISEGLPVSAGTRNIVAPMRQHGVRRLIAVATPSAADPSDRFSLPFALAVLMIRNLAGSAYDDIRATADAVRGSGLDWTLARLPMLAEPKPGARAHAGFIGDSAIKLFSLSRNGLADFLLDQLTDRSWVGKAPALSDTR